MRKSLLQLCIVALLLSLCLSAACAETVRGDLNERFSDIPRIELDGVRYRLRSRLTTVLAMGLGDNGQGSLRADLAMLLVIDDDAKTFAAIEIRPNTLVQLEVDGEMQNMRFGDLFMLDPTLLGTTPEPDGTPKPELMRAPDDGKERCLNMVKAANLLLGEELIEHYMAFDAEGVKVIDESIEGDTRTRLKAMLAQVDEMSSEELNETYKDLGDYILTDLKSGAAMKVLNKYEKYENLERVFLSGTEADAGEAGIVIVPNEEEILRLRASAFYVPE